MDIGSVLLLLAMALVVAAFVGRPLRERRVVEYHVQEDHVRSHLLAERERILEALTELDFDNDMGKIPDEIYPAQREALLRKGAETLRELDALQQTESTESELEARIERAARVRGKSDDPLEALIADRRSKKSQKIQPSSSSSAKFCPDCGQAIQPGDRFCASCGAKIG